MEESTKGNKLDSFGYCFLCLKSANFEQVLINHILKYLQIKVKHLPSNVNQSFVQLCQMCRKNVEKFNKLSLFLEGIQMELNYYLKVITNSIENEDQSRLLELCIRRQYGNQEEAVSLETVDELRKLILSKSNSLELERSEPRVKIKRLEEVEIPKRTIKIKVYAAPPEIALPQDDPPLPEDYPKLKLEVDEDEDIISVDPLKEDDEMPCTSASPPPPPGQGVHTYVIIREKNMERPKLPVKTCSNCGTTSSTMWRRDNLQQRVCNACGLHLKSYGVNRPLKLRKDKIFKRNRKPKEFKHIWSFYSSKSKAKTPEASPNQQFNLQPQNTSNLNEMLPRIIHTTSLVTNKNVESSKNA